MDNEDAFYQDSSTMDKYLIYLFNKFEINDTAIITYKPDFLKAVDEDLSLRLKIQKIDDGGILIEVRNTVGPVEYEAELVRFLDKLTEDDYDYLYGFMETDNSKIVAILERDKLNANLPNSIDSTTSIFKL